jgi:hypothetical protein
MIDAHDPAQNDTASNAIGRAIFNVTDGERFVIEFTTIGELLKGLHQAETLMWPKTLEFETLEIDMREAEVGVSPLSVSAYLAGLSIPDGPTVAALEMALDAPRGT